MRILKAKLPTDGLKSVVTDPKYNEEKTCCKIMFSAFSN
jgi:hypothetical protein